MGDIRLWSVALLADELNTQRQFHLSGFEPDLVGYWPMSEVTGTDIYFNDHSINNARGKFTGGAQWFAGTMPKGRVFSLISFPLTAF
ncbi:MAG: hypothetical protein ACI81P_003682 [Neolewinella sp.]|jgi:hypothetical protein